MAVFHKVFFRVDVTFENSKMLIRVLGIFLFGLLTVSSWGQTAPSAASNVIFPGTTYCSQTEVSWTNGGGAGRIVIASKGAAVSVTPINNTYYLADSRFGYGALVGTDQYVVYNGSGNSVVIDDLEKNTTYYFAVFEYNGGGTIYTYTTTYPEASITTKNITSSFTIDDPYQCEHENFFTFTSNASQDASSPLSYKWNFGDGNTATTQNATHTYNTYRINQVSLEVSSFKCKDVMIKADTVAPLPEFEFDLVPDSVMAGYTAEQCFYKPDGSSNRFYLESSFTNKYLNVVSGTGIIDDREYFWFFGDGAGDEKQPKVNHSYSEPGVYNVKLIMAGRNSFTKYCTDSVEMTVTVYPSPIDSSKIFYDTVQCLDNNLFVFEHNNLNPQITNTWNFGDGNSQVGQQADHSYTIASKYGFKLEAVDQNGCYGFFEDTIEVVPQPENEIEGLAARYCEGDDIVVLINTAESGEWISVAVDDQTNEFDPSAVGTYELKYAVDEDGCKDTATVSTIVYPVPKFELGKDTSVCAGSSIELSVAQDTTNISWSTGSTDTSIQVSARGIVWAEKRYNGCSFRDSLFVEVISAPQVDLGADSLMCGDGVRIVNVNASEATYEWNDGYNGGGQREIRTTGTYSVVVTNKCGSDADEVNLEFLPYVCDIFIPNAFTPNGDGTNDLFKPSGNVDLTSFKVFNRWGEMLYSADDPKDVFAWDGKYNGKLVQGGTYFFFVSYLLPVEGTTKSLTESGMFYLID